MSFWKRLFGGGTSTEPEPVEAGPPARAARSPELEAAIERDPEAIEPYLVYGDWLEAQGDPRGQLIQMQGKLAAQRGSWVAQPTRRYHPQGVEPIRVPTGELATAAAALIAKHRAHFLGPIDPGQRGARRSGTRGEHVEWHCGFVRSLRFRPAYDDLGGAPEVLAAFCAHPSARFLRALSVGTAYGDGASVDLIGEAPLPATLRTLYLGDFDFPDENEMSWSQVGDVSPLYARAPRLTHLVLQGVDVGLGETVDLEGLRHLEILTGGLPREALHAIAASELPALETLIVWTGDEGYGSTVTPADLDALIEALPGFPALRHLGIRNCEHTDAIVPALVASPLLPRLEVLDLALGTLTSDGAGALSAARDRLRHLERLDLSENLLDDRELASVGSLAREVRTEDQRAGDMDEGMRYVAVSE